MNRLARLYLEYFTASLLLGLPSYFAWFRRPFLISLHEFDFFLGLFTEPRVQSPISLVLLGGIFHIALVGWISWTYYRIVLQVSGPNETASKKDLASALVLMLPAFFYLPWISPDVFYYLASGWIQAAHHFDPYNDLILDAPDFPWHPVHQNNPHPQVFTMYGPLFSLLMKGVMGLSGGQVALSLFFLKALSLALLLACTQAARVIAKDLGVKDRAVTLCFLLNPVLLISDLGCGHNDLILLLALLLSVLLVLRKHFAWSVVILALGAGFKYVPLILLPAYFVYFLKQDPTVKNFARLACLGLLFCSLLVLPNLLFEGGLANFLRLLSARDTITANTVYLVSLRLAEIAGFGSPAIVKSLFRGLFLLIYLVFLGRIFLSPRKPDRQDFFVLIMTVFLGYFAIGSSEIHEWYVTWFFAFVFWINRLSFFNVGIFFGCALQAFAVYTGRQMVLLNYFGWALMFGCLWLCLWHLFKNRRPLPSPLFRLSDPPESH